MAEVVRSQEPGTSQGTDSQVAYDKLGQVHQLLIENYVRILREVSKLPPFGGRGSKNDQWGGDWSISRVLVRLFCEAHIRRQLTVLSRIYQLQQGLKGIRTSQTDSLEKGHESCERILGAIPSRQGVKLFLATASPVALGLFVAMLGVENVYEAAVKLASPEFRTRIGASLQIGLLVSYSLLAVIYLLAFFAGSFAYKRGMFFPAVRYREMSNWSRRLLARNRTRRGLEDPQDGINVYAIENHLFDELQFTKLREPRIDIFITLGTVVPGLLAWFLFVATAGRDEEFSAIVIFTVAFVLIGGAVILRALQVARRREWR
jgi:hypothetical protein